MRIIVVDDKEEERYLSETLLKGSGYEVETAVNGAEALEKLRTEGFDMIVSDVLMPVMDGFRLCRECKGDEKLKDIPFIFYTATYKDERDEELASKVGADKFIRKPIEPEEFVKIIQGVSRDVEEGKIGPKKRVLEEEREVLKLYSERLIAKLEKKMLDLEREITERKRGEEALRESEEKYRSVAQSANDAIISADSSGNITFWNKAAQEMFGYTEEEVLGQPLTLLMPERYKDAYQRGMERVRSTGESRLVGKTVEFSGLRKDGSEFPFELSLASWEVGGEVFYTSIIRDITERKRAEEKARQLETLKELDRMRVQLLANVSHELRTPLTSIKGFATTLLRQDVRWSEEEQRDFLQTVDQETDRLARLISDLLDMSRIESGALKLEKGNYQISEIMEGVRDKLTILTEHHQLEIIVPARLPPVFVDEMRIGQVITNLVENATKYSREGSPITIEAQLAGAQIIISVADKGEGIASELLDRVFDRFYQTESIVTGRKSGTGLGLSICKGIIQSHSGRIWVESQLGKGSKFSFSLPVGKGEEEIA